MMFRTLMGLLAALFAIASLGLGLWRRTARRPRPQGSTPGNDPSKTPSSGHESLSGLSSVPPAKSLKQLHDRMGSSSALPPEVAQGVQERIHELIEALTEAQSVLRAGAPDRLNAAAKKMVYCHWLTGLAWRKYLAVSGPAAKAGQQVREALAQDARPLVEEISRLLEAQPAPALVRQDKGFGLACAACGEVAVTFAPEKGYVYANSLSPVNTLTRWQGETAQRLAELLAGGSARALLDYFSPLGPGGLANYCPLCDRVYCREHYAVEAEWSGSWHESSCATCPLGHEREFE